MTPFKTPFTHHLLNAHYNWLVECGVRVDILINNRQAKLDILQNYESPEGFVVLNITPGAVDGLSISADGVFFNARFQGISRYIPLPLASVYGVFVPQGEGRTMLVDLQNGFSYEFQGSPTIPIVKSPKVPTPPPHQWPPMPEPRRSVEVKSNGPKVVNLFTRQAVATEANKEGA